MKRTITACLLMVLALVASIPAEIPRLFSEELRAKGTHIISGRVKWIGKETAEDGQWLNTIGVVEIQVTKVEKGNKIELGDAVYARF